MPRVVIRPTVVEYGVNRDAYDELIAELQSQGVDARIDQPPEERSGSLQHSALDVAIYLFENADNIAMITGAVALAMKKLRKKPRAGARAPRRAAIFGPNGEVLKQIDLDEHPDA